MYTYYKKAVLNSYADRYEVMVLTYNEDGKHVKTKTYKVHAKSMARFYKLSDGWMITRMYEKTVSFSVYRKLCWRKLK